MVIHSNYIGQLLRPAAAPLIVHMCIHLGGVAMVCDYLHPALQLPLTLGVGIPLNVNKYAK